MDGLAHHLWLTFMVPRWWIMLWKLVQLPHYPKDDSLLWRPPPAVQSFTYSVQYFNTYLTFMVPGWWILIILMILTLFLLIPAGLYLSCWLNSPEFISIIYWKVFWSLFLGFDWWFYTVVISWWPLKVMDLSPQPRITAQGRCDNGWRASQLKFIPPGQILAREHTEFRRETCWTCSPQSLSPSHQHVSIVTVCMLACWLLVMFNQHHVWHEHDGTDRYSHMHEQFSKMHLECLWFALISSFLITAYMSMFMSAWMPPVQEWTHMPLWSIQ